MHLLTWHVLTRNGRLLPVEHNVENARKIWRLHQPLTDDWVTLMINEHIPCSKTSKTEHYSKFLEHWYTQQKIDPQKVIEVHRNNWGHHTPGAEVREAPHWIAGRWHVSPPHSSSTCSLSTPPQPAYAPSTSVPTTANLNVYSHYCFELSNQGSYFL